MINAPLLHDVAPGVVFPVWVVYKDANNENAQGVIDTTKVFTDLKDAKLAALGCGLFGDDAYIAQLQALRDNNDHYWLISSQISDINEVRSQYEKKIRQQALRKLSAEEKQILKVCYY